MEQISQPLDWQLKVIDCQVGDEDSCKAPVDHRPEDAEGEEHHPSADPACVQFWDTESTEGEEDSRAVVQEALLLALVHGEGVDCHAEGHGEAGPGGGKGDPEPRVEHVGEGVPALNKGNVGKLGDSVCSNKRVIIFCMLFCLLQYTERSWYKEC